MSTFKVKRTLVKHEVTRPIGLKDRAHSQFYSPSTIDDFLFEENANGSYNLTSDIHMLLNQKRLDRQTTESLIQHFEQAAQKSDSLRELRSKLSDEELCKFVKSRYIQSPSELLSYSEYMLKEYSQLSDEAQAYMQAQQQEKEVTDTSTTTTTTTTTTSE